MSRESSETAGSGITERNNEGIRAECPFCGKEVTLFLKPGYPTKKLYWSCPRCRQNIVTHKKLFRWKSSVNS